ncbi:hypothetical protein [Streptomyces vietnamensis]|uniref:hypothetical protein n=1 Tax=Streptomyces vietnamensis TaxID=362257 RepID=UPI00342A1DA5
MSVAKAAACIGLPAHRPRPVATNAYNRLDTAALHAAVAADLDAGLLPICTVTTLGTTVTGAVDPLEPGHGPLPEPRDVAPRGRARGGLGAGAPALAPGIRGSATSIR